MNEQRSLQSVAGLNLHLEVWPVKGPPKGAVVIAHGLGEHVRRYDHVAAHLNAKGLAVYAADHVGFGTSGGKKGDVPGGLDTLLRDLLAVRDAARAELGDDTRMILLGHSMGGLLTLALLQRYPGSFAEAVATGPAMSVTRGVNPLLLGASKMLSVIAPGMTLANGLDPKAICTDPKVVADYEADPLVHDKISSRLFAGMRQANKELWSTAQPFDSKLRLMIMHGAKDSICHPDDVQRFFDRLQLDEKRFELWPGMFHEIMNEPDQAQVFAAIDDFLGLA